jgi:hypothetical protein
MLWLTISCSTVDLGLAVFLMIKYLLASARLSFVSIYPFEREPHSLSYSQKGRARLPTGDSDRTECDAVVTP